MREEQETEVLVVGAGVTGAAIARELSRYRVQVVVAEKEADVAGGQTKCNSGMVYSPVGLTWAGSLIIKSIVDEPGGALLHPESIKERLTLKGFNIFESMARELDVSSFTRNRSIMVAVNEEDVRRLNAIEGLCHQIGFEPERLSKEAIMAMEPNITDKVICGLMDATSESFIYPWEYCMALAENASENGVSILTGAGVKAIRTLDGGFVVTTDRGLIRTRFIVNAAGAYADKVAGMAGVCDFGLTFLQGQTEILDKRLKGLINNSISSCPQPGGGGRINPLPSGNISIGFLEYMPCDDRDNESLRKEWTETSISRSRNFVPAASQRDIITSFTGMRVFNTRDPEDHIIEASRKCPNFINAAVRLPGLAASPAIAGYVVDILGNQGLELVRKDDYNPRRRGIPKVSELAGEDRQRLISRDARYGHVVCRCEEVTEGEIVEAVRRGARTVAGVKYRTRAGMGRCQGGFCGTRVVGILARELDIPVTAITQRGGLSRVLLYRSKELLGQVIRGN